MKQVSKFLSLFIAVSAMVLLTSALPASTVKDGHNTSTITTSSAKPGQLTYSELKKIATEVKGSKLTLKERIGLRLFGKKIANKVPFSGGDKSQVIALILCALLGGLGIHRFYLGYTWQGIVQLLTLGGCGLWALIDLIRIFTGSLQPKDGQYGKTL